MVSRKLPLVLQNWTCSSSEVKRFKGELSTNSSPVATDPQRAVPENLPPKVALLANTAIQEKFPSVHAQGISMAQEPAHF